MTNKIQLKVAAALAFAFATCQVETFFNMLYIVGKMRGFCIAALVQITIEIVETDNPDAVISGQ